MLPDDVIARCVARTGLTPDELCDRLVAEVREHIPPRLHMDLLYADPNGLERLRLLHNAQVKRWRQRQRASILSRSSATTSPWRTCEPL